MFLTSKRLRNTDSRSINQDLLADHIHLIASQIHPFANQIHVSEATHFIVSTNDEVLPLKKVFPEIKFHARNILADPSKHEHLANVINHSVATIIPADYRNYCMNMYVKLDRTALYINLHMSVQISLALNEYFILISCHFFFTQTCDKIFISK